jgi:hypothetical protein
MSTTTPRRTSPGSSAIPPTAPQAARTRWPDPAPPGSAVRAACIHQRRAPGSPDRSRLAAKARMAAGHVPAVRPGSEQFGRAGLRRGLPCVSCNDSRANFQSGAVVRFRTPPRIRCFGNLCRSIAFGRLGHTKDKDTMRILLPVLAVITLCLGACHQEGPAERAGQNLDNAGQRIGDTLNPPQGPAQSAGRKIDRALGD